MEKTADATLADDAEPREVHLGPKHRALGATMALVDESGWIVPAAYLSEDREYAAVRDGGVGLFDLSSRGRLEVWGSEATQFLNGTVTNDVEKLAPGKWFDAAFPTVQGRLIAIVRIARIGEKFLLDTEAVTGETVRKLLERFTLAGDFHVRDVAQETVELSLQGAAAEQTLSRVFPSASTIERNSHITTKLKDEDVTIWRATHTGEDGFDLVTNVRIAEELWDELVAAGAEPSGYYALETLRVEAGIPRFGQDATDASVVLEIVDEDSAVSYTKKCYIGQEIIARVHWRGHVAKKLVGLELEPNSAVSKGSLIMAVETDREIGRLTSVCFSPRLATNVALGTVKFDHIATGTKVQIVASDGKRSSARVTQLPIVRGGWSKDREDSRVAETQL